TIPNSSKAEIGVNEFSGVDAVDKASTNYGPAGGTTFNAGTITTTGNSDLLLGVIGYNSSVSGTATQWDGNWYASPPVIANSSYKIATSYQILNSPQTINGTGITTAGWGAAIIALTYR